VNARNFFAELKPRNVYKLAVSFVRCGKELALLEIAPVLGRLTLLLHRKRESQFHVNG
jgi:hypothetical protein